MLRLFGRRPLTGWWVGLAGDRFRRDDPEEPVPGGRRVALGAGADADPALIAYPGTAFAATVHLLHGFGWAGFALVVLPVPEVACRGSITGGGSGTSSAPPPKPAGARR